ncbi:NAD(P)-dependent alcohol dehydrogenase [Leifsonia sp. P73]|uniref:NAD(P)-dependent alcohol dehydrogenase n=1 Tax=Leifsonia sp. P73 TaxID=3423959 RepID=UPI003DA21756
MTATSTPALPTKMSASVLTTPGVIELRDVPIPELDADQVLVRIEAVGVCGSDTHFYHEGHIGDLVVEGPIILGHESAGVIVAVGSAVSAARIGERVSIEPQRPCRRCEHCKTGDYNLCVAMEFYGAYPIDGVFSEYAVIQDDFAFAVPDSLSADEAALIEPVSVAVHACRRAAITASSRVFITGAGPIGLLTAQVALAFGASEVVVSDPVENRRRFAQTLGDIATVDPVETDFGSLELHFDAYIDASGNGRAIRQAIPTLRRGGRIVLVGMGNDDLELPVSVIQNRELELTGTYRYANTWPTAIELVARGAVRVAPLVTGHVGLDQVEAGLLMNRSDPDAIKTVVVPGRPGAAALPRGER